MKRIFECFGLKGSRNDADRMNLSPVILSTLGITVDDAISKWTSEFDGINLKQDLELLSRKELNVCKDKLEKLLEEKVLELLFGNNIDLIKKKDFFLNDLDHYFNYYLYETDFGNDFANNCISIQKLGGEGYVKEFELSMQYRLERSIQELRVNIPFKQQYGSRSDLYKLDMEKINIKYLGKNDKIECILRLVYFVQKIDEFLRKSMNDRRLGVFDENYGKE